MNIFSSSGSMGKEGMQNLREYGLTKKIEAGGAQINNDMLIRRDQQISDSDRTDLSLYSTKRGLSSSTTSVFTEDASSSSSSSSSSSPTSSSSSSSSIDDNNGPLYELSELMAKLPLKRGLSKYYDGKSQSFFTSLAEEVNSVEDLVKKENPYNKRIKLCKISYDWTAFAEDR